MKSKHVFFTKTLGDLYLKQGYHKDAEKLFKALLVKEPGREDLLAALAMCEKHKNIEANVASGDLVGLVRRWAVLLREEGQKTASAKGNCC